MIEIKNVFKSYGKNDNKTEVLKGVSFNVWDGDFVVIQGTSGSGKTTLLNCISGIETVDEGEVVFDGENITDYNSERRKKFRRESIGMVFQSFDLLPILNVRENILLPLKLNYTKIDSAYFEEVINRLNIESKMGCKISDLSGGQQQRVAIARALITKPKILLADEPTGNLDRKNTLEVMELFRKINKEMKTTILMITHDEKIADYGNKKIYIDDGRIV